MTTTPSPLTHSTVAAPLPPKWIDKLFGRFDAYYGARFGDQWRGSDLDMVKAVWAEKLGQLTPDELRRGVDALGRCRYPPTLPEFFELCRPLPDYEESYREAVRQMRARETGTDKWSSRAVFWAACAIGSWDLMSRSYPELKVRWRVAYDRALADERAGALAEIPPRLDALPAPGSARVDAAEVRRRIDELRAQFVRAG